MSTMPTATSVRNHELRAMAATGQTKADALRKLADGRLADDPVIRPDLPDAGYSGIRLTAPVSGMRRSGSQFPVPYVNLKARSGGQA